MAITEFFTFIPQILAGLGVTGAAASARWVEPGDRALVKRFGKPIRHHRGPKAGQYRVLGPGFNMVIPGIDKLAKTHVRQRVVNLGDEEITLKDTTVFTVDGVLVMTVKDTPDDLHRALFEVDNLDSAIRFYCISVMREYLRELTYDQLIGGDANHMRDQLTGQVKDRLAQWGMEVHEFRLGDLSPYGDTLRMIQTAGSAELRVKALEAVAGRLRELGLNPMLAATVIGMPVSTAISVQSDTPTRS